MWSIDDWMKLWSVNAQNSLALAWKVWFPWWQNMPSAKVNVVVELKQVEVVAEPAQEKTLVDVTPEPQVNEQLPLPQTQVVQAAAIAAPMAASETQVKPVKKTAGRKPKAKAVQVSLDLPKVLEAEDSISKPLPKTNTKRTTVRAKKSPLAAKTAAKKPSEVVKSDDEVVSASVVKVQDVVKELTQNGVDE